MYDHGSKGNKKEAEKFASWMRRGGFQTRLVKRSDGWHVESSSDFGEEETHARNEAENRYRASLPRTEHEQRTGSYNPFATKTEAKDALGMGGGAYEPRTSHPFGRWLQKREKRKETLLTVPVEPKEPKPEKSRNRLAEDMADKELAQTRTEMKGVVTSGTLNPDTDESMRKDSHNHLIFRRHSYLPTLGVHLPVGAYGKSPYKGDGLSNMANDPNTRN